MHLIANCGCVHHAEEEIPCVHDVLLRATAAFETVLVNTSFPGTRKRTRTREEIHALEKANWKEIPSDGWHFVHHDFPGVMIDWVPGSRIRPCNIERG